MNRVERRDRMIDAVEQEAGFESLKGVVQACLNDGIDKDELLEDLSEIKALLPIAIEEVVEDVMDLLTGWCAPQARLSPEL